MIVIWIAGLVLWFVLMGSMYGAEGVWFPALFMIYGAALPWFNSAVNPEIAGQVIIGGIIAFLGVNISLGIVRLLRRRLHRS